VISSDRGRLRIPVGFFEFIVWLCLVNSIRHGQPAELNDTVLVTGQTVCAVAHIGAAVAGKSWTRPR